MGIASVDFTRDDPRDVTDVEAEPTIRMARQLASPDGTTALAVMLESGMLDRFFYALEPGEHSADGGMELEGRFGHVRSEVDQIVSAHVVGERLSVPGFELRLPDSARTGTIERVDYENNLVYVDADLPADGRLKWQNILFSHPDYVRNSAYTINEIRREGDLSVIDLGPQRIILGKAEIARDPMSPTTLTSLVPHDYVKPKFGPSHFFDGKRLATADGGKHTQVASVEYGQPMQIEVDSTEGFRQGDTLYYMDIKPGDTFTINNWAAFELTPTGEVIIAATDDVTVEMGGRTLNWDWEPR
jgi:hypothetical protein